jgi:hypothetical protein
MAFQPGSFFQPPSKPSLRERAARLGNSIRSFALPAEGVPPLEETPWQRGKRQASDFANGRGVVFMIVCAPIFAVGGLFVLTSVSWPLRVFLAAVIGLGVALAAALLISGAYALRAPYRQTGEARKYARALEAHLRDYVQWARRREIAYDFRHDTLINEVVRFRPEEEGGPTLMGSLADEETRWRSILANTSAQIEANGGDVSTFIQAQLAFLDNADGAFEAGDLARIRNSMLSACQNLLGEIRQEGPPEAPTPPSEK